MADINDQDRAQNEAGSSEEPHVLFEDEDITLGGAYSPQSAKESDSSKENKESEESQEIPDEAETDDEVSDSDNLNEDLPSRVSGRTRSKGPQKAIPEKANVPNPTQGAHAAQNNTEHIEKIKALKADILRLNKQTVESNAQLETLSKKAQTDAEKLENLNKQAQSDAYALEMLNRKA